MDKRLSILHSDKEEIDLETNKSDILAAFVRAIFGAVPTYGPAIVEIITGVIPEQKSERICRWAGVFEVKLNLLTDDVESIKHKLKTEQGSDLLEDALNQASRAISPERIEYIASLLINGLTIDDLDHIGKKKLFSTLNELNDAEILWLKYYSLSTMGQQGEFAERHSELFAPLKLCFGASQQDIDKAAPHYTYERKLLEVGLIESTYKKPNKGEIPDFDEKTGTLKSSGYRVTSVGRLLLRYIGVAERD